MSETRNERRIRERRERKTRKKNAPEEKRKSDRITGWVYFVVGAAILASGWVCYQRLTIPESSLERFEGDFVGRVRQRRSCGIVYRAKSGVRRTVQFIYHHREFRDRLKGGDQIEGFLHGQTIVELSINRTKVIELELYRIWGRNGLIFCLVAGPLIFLSGIAVLYSTRPEK